MATPDIDISIGMYSEGNVECSLRANGLRSVLLPDLS
jgi:hypothetical protein